MVMDNIAEEQPQEVVQEPENTGITDLTPEVGLPQEESYGGETDEPQQEQPVQQQEAPAQPPPAPEPMPVNEEAVRAQVARMQAENDELARHRAQEQDRLWREDVGRRARGYMQQLEQQGYMPEQARDQARRMIQQEQQTLQMQQQAYETIGIAEGKNIATLQYMREHGLIDNDTLEVFRVLQGTNNPTQMKREAERIKRDRERDAELAQLRQGQVQPQTFDNSQGSAEASTSEDRLINAYLNGDRSEAAVRAARNLTFGG